MPSTNLIATLPVGITGLNGSANQSQVPLSALIEATNLHYQNGTLEKEGGAAKYNTTAIAGAPSIIGGHDWFPTAGTQRMIVVTSGGDILKDDGTGAFATTLKSGLTVSDVVPVFVEGGKEAAANDRKLFIFTQKNVVQQLAADGATTTDIAFPPADWATTNQPRFGLIHRTRLWGGGNANDPHRLYYSTIGTHGDFQAAGSGSIAIHPGEGERLVGAVSFKDFIICFKFPKGIYAVDTRDATVANWSVQKINDRIGCVGEGAIVPVDDDILFVDPGGNFHLISRVTDESFGANNISDEQDIGTFIRERVNLARLKFMQSVYYVVKREIHFAVSQVGDSVNNARLVIDLNRPGLLRWRFSDRDVCQAMWLRQDSSNVPRLTVGDNAGFVWRLDQVAKNKDGAGYSSQFQTPHFDFSHIDPALSSVRKNGQWLEVVIEPKGNWDMDVDVLWDGDFHQTVSFNMGVIGAALGSFVLDTDRLSGGVVVNKKRRITGSGRRLSLVGRNTGADQDFSVSTFLVHYDIGANRLGTTQ